MKKRKQRKIRFGKNKGKIKSKTIHYNRGKKTKTVEYRDATDKTKLQKGGFLEAPITYRYEHESRNCWCWTYWVYFGTFTCQRRGKSHHK